MHYRNSTANTRRCRGIRGMLRKHHNHVSESSSICQLFKTHNLCTSVSNSLFCWGGKGKGVLQNSFLGALPPHQRALTGSYKRLDAYVASRTDSSGQGHCIQSPLKLTDGSKAPAHSRPAHRAVSSLPFWMAPHTCCRAQLCFSSEESFLNTTKHKNSWGVFIAPTHTSTTCTSDPGFYSTCFSSALGSDGSRAPRDRNEGVSVTKRDPLHPPRTVGWQWARLKPADAVRPPEIQTRLLCKVQGEDGSSRIYNDHNKTLFSTSTAEFRDNFPLPHICASSPPLRWFMLFPPPPCLPPSARSTVNREKQLHQENWHSSHSECHWSLHPSAEIQVYESPAFEFKHWI